MLGVNMINNFILLTFYKKLNLFFLDKMAEIAELENADLINLHFCDGGIIKVEKNTLKKMEYFNALLTRWEDKPDIKMPDYVDKSTFLELIKTFYFKDYKSNDPNLEEYKNYYGVSKLAQDELYILRLDDAVCIIDFSKIKYINLYDCVEDNICTVKSKISTVNISYSESQGIRLFYKTPLQLLQCCAACKTSYTQEKNKLILRNNNINKLIGKLVLYSNKYKKDLFQTNKKIASDDTISYINDNIFILENSKKNFINLSTIISIKSEICDIPGCTQKKCKFILTDKLLENIEFYYIPINCCKSCETWFNNTEIVEKFINEVYKYKNIKIDISMKI